MGEGSHLLRPEVGVVFVQVAEDLGTLERERDFALYATPLGNRIVYLIAGLGEAFERARMPTLADSPSDGGFSHEIQPGFRNACSVG